MILRLARCFRADVIASGKFALIWFLVLVVFTMISYFSHYLELQTIAEIAPDYQERDWTFGDCLLTFVQGQSAYIPEDGSRFQLPIVWFMLWSLILYGVLRYPSESLGGFGQLTLIASGNFWIWWLSKCLWCIACVFAYMFVIATSCSIISFLFAGEPSLLACLDVPSFERISGFDYFSNEKFDMSTMFIPCLLVAASLALFQMGVSMIFGPMIAYASSLSWLLIGAYCDIWFAIPRFSMVVRSDVLSASGWCLSECIALCVGFALASIIVGGFMVSRFDRLKKRG